MIIRRTNDAEPIMNAMKDYGDVIDRHHRSGAVGAKMIGSLDPITASVWAKESGLKIGTKEFAQFASKRIKEDIDFRKFRMGH